MNPSHASPPFITLDGIDGVGKSTQIDFLIDHLRGRGLSVLQVRDPGGTSIGTRLREILLDSDCDMHRRTEAMLFMASRCELIESVISPALREGKAVVSDRFLLANVVYQSIGGDVSADQLWQMGHWANGGVRPGLTILLDMPAAESMRRIDRPADRMESRGVDYMENVRLAFLEQLPHSSEETVVVDAAQEPQAVREEMLMAVNRFLEHRC